MMQNLKKELSYEFKTDMRNLTNFDVSTQKFALMDCLPKCIMFELRKYRGVMFDGNQDWYKI